MSNFKFLYLYRDGGNYKSFDAVVFNNNLNFNLEYVEMQITANLIGETWFYAEAWGVRSLFESLNIDDPTWHEFEAVEYTEETGEIDILDFLKVLPVQ